MARLGMLIDMKRCIGCDACTVACAVENFTPPGIWYAPVYRKEVGKYPNAKKVFLPTLCMHCKDAPCIKACPTNALYKRDDGIVLVDENKCCGTRACMSACPYGALHLLEEEETRYPGEATPYEKFEDKPVKFQKGTVQKCTFCVHRVDQGLEPACVESCPTNCRIFGDMDDPNSKISKYAAHEQEKGREPFALRPDAETNPSVRHLDWK